MASPASATITCPVDDCETQIQVPIALTSSYDGDRFILRIEPDSRPVAEHVQSHA